MITFKLPDLGEGLPDAEIRQWHVKVGDLIKADMPLVSMETAKAIVDVPSPYTGTVTVLHGKVGEIIKTGQPLVEFSEVSGRIDTGTVAGQLEEGQQSISYDPKVASRSLHALSPKVHPLARRMAAAQGLDLSLVQGTGPQGLIMVHDLPAQGNELPQGWEVLKGPRRAMAQAMRRSADEVVPVTVHEDVDISHWSHETDVTVKLIQAIVAACKKEPALNAWYRSDLNARLVHSEVHLGLAVDSAEGLFVPVIQNVQNLEPSSLRKQIETLKTKVAERSLSPEALKGATFMLSNYGKFAGRYANPIIIPPLVAILGAGRNYRSMQLIKGEPKDRSWLPLSLSMDHRCVTGGEATRFLQAIIDELGRL